MWGFVYLALILIVTLVLPLVADQIPTLPVLESTAEKCVKNPNDFNVTHKWQCSLFSGGTLAEQCANYPGRFGFDTSKSQCYSLIPPSNLSG
jgi:hypothetical protein